MLRTARATAAPPRTARRHRAYGAAAAGAAAPLYDYRALQTTNHLGLPRLPIPELAATMERYLHSVSAWATATEQRREQEALIKDFLQSDGPRLQKLLKDADAEQARRGRYPFSYMEKLWHDMYLCDRSAVAINSNPSYVLVDERAAADMAQAKRAARFVTAALKWHRKVKLGQLEADKAGFCLSPMALQLGTARVPRPDRDELQHHTDARHIVLLRRNHFYRVDVYAEDGRQLHEADLARRIASVLEDKAAPAPPVCALTGADRATWARVRAELQAASPVNRATLAAVDGALLVVALDDEAAADLRDRSVATMTGPDGRNRWFDKHSVIVRADGMLGLNFEHSFSDGVNWNRWVWEAWCDMHGEPSGYGALPATAGPGQVALPAPERLGWELPSGLAAAVEEHAARFATAVRDVRHSVLNFTDFGKADIKRWKVSPDAVAQIAFQTAFHQQHGVLAATYEACSTSTFHHGRTETIRSATPEVAQLVASLAKGDAAASAQLLRKAAEKHAQLSKDAQKAQGIDRHLFALRSLQQRADGRLAPLFQHPLHQQSRHWRLSTSTVPLPCIRTFNFGAVVADGYGIGYAVNDASLTGIITNYADAGTDGARLRDDIGSAVRRFRALLH